MSIKKIAEMSGVSIATVSRVLNNPDYHCSSEAVRDRIMDAARQLHYVPNTAARNLKMGKRPEVRKIRQIHILVTRMEHDKTDPFFVELLHIVEREIQKKECALGQIWYRPVFSDDKKMNTLDAEKAVEEMLSDADLEEDGLVVIGKCNEKALTFLKKKGNNIVSVNRNSTNYIVDEVVCDGAKIAALAIDRLVELGHENIGYVGGCFNETRYHGYIDAIKRHNLELQANYIIETEQTEKAGYEVMQRLSREKEVPSAIYCANDILALGMLRYMKELAAESFRPSIISSDGIREIEQISPRLTTVKIPWEDMGQLAIMLLLDRMEKGHESVAKLEVNGKLSEGKTCYPAM